MVVCRLVCRVYFFNISIYSLFCKLFKPNSCYGGVFVFHNASCWNRESMWARQVCLSNFLKLYNNKNDLVLAQFVLYMLEWI